MLNRNRLRRAGLALFAASVFVADGASADSSASSPVVLSVTVNTAEVNGFDRVHVKRLPPPGKTSGLFSDDDFQLSYVDGQVGRDTRFLIGFMPPGEYRFVSFHSGTKELKVGEKNLLGTFTVSGGHPVDLGRLILTPVNSKVLIGRFARAPTNVDLLRRHTPGVLKRFTTPAANGWTGPVDGAPELEKYALANPYGAQCASERADGTVVAASRLGTVLMRSADGRWHAVQGPGLESVLCVLPVDLPDTELVAVGELGTFLRKPRGVEQLQPIDPGNLPPGNLLRIAGSPASGWFVVSKTGENMVSLYRSAKLDAGDWQLVLSEPERDQAGRDKEPMFTWQTESGLGYSSAKGPMHVFEHATGKWSERALPPGYNRLMHMAVGTKGQLNAQIANSSWVIVIEESMVSHDLGASWTKRKVPVRIPPQPVVELHDGTMWTTLNNQIITSSDNGATWPVNGQHNGETVLPLRSGVLLKFDYPRYGLFSIKASADQGKGWKTEYSNFNLAAYQSDKK